MHSNPCETRTKGNAQISGDLVQVGMASYSFESGNLLNICISPVRNLLYATFTATKLLSCLLDFWKTGGPVPIKNGC
jgi:hypothetical protein